MYRGDVKFMAIPKTVCYIGRGWCGGGGGGGGGGWGFGVNGTWGNTHDPSQ